MTPPADPRLHEVPSSPAPAAAPARPGGRRRVLVGAVLAALLVAIALGAHALLTRGEESTDDAQVEADVVAIAPRVAGPVAEVLVADNAQVRQGQPLVRVDPADYEVRVRQAEAELATAQAQAAAAEAQVSVARAGVTRAEAESEKAALDLRRAEELKAGDAIAAERYDATRIAGATARAGAGANRAQYAAALASGELARARVKAAQAAVDLARLQRSYTEVRAPASGRVSRLAARVGQIVQPGQSLGQLVPDRTYVIANFKETQTGEIRPGQPVDVEIDAYGGRTLHGKVESISGGTGARFALLPPDNASGNFVKVVERVPVRIAWDAVPADLPLRAGLSAFVTVHTR
ncbi:secretion protein HlyD family protein [Anaeromyxobacter dehalogenans 2CP-1]|uniref:Secretion protein HlyD family protein n=1 Tax=Anaeromyxobacter dehalogenans (strain ATCC BAA-258 / DSM 21875 / 2CP-1) TaxID=455488 RepID=B8JB88_ANAD2|nr:HlyD family secretion protein [Anaeromyxobacter dehalogenans]ACL65715.1 secretion protein HlyD family protein [Anaeromyxobacter dehalogenans 2CP-1]